LTFHGAVGGSAGAVVGVVALFAFCFFFVDWRLPIFIAPALLEENEQGKKLNPKSKSTATSSNAQTISIVPLYDKQ
jgi:hypothetical protein